jgi:nicotinate-nucleotide adenylyltransferase
MTGADGGGPIGVLGGTFDPVHNGHLRLAIEAREELALDHVRLIAAGIPNHRRPPEASTALRIEMLQAAVGRDGSRVDTREVERDGVSYTIETLESLREDFGDRPVCLIMGLDAFNGLPGWHRWREIASYAHVVVATRPQVVLSEDPPLAEFVTRAEVDDPARLSSTSAGLVYFLRIPLLPISSTDIRERLRRGRSVEHLLPDPVLRIIERDRPYAKKF